MSKPLNIAGAALLTSKQEQAAVLEGRGIPVTKISEAIGVSRETIYQWRQQPEYAYRVQQERELCVTEIRERHGNLGRVLQGMSTQLLQQLKVAKPAEGSKEPPLAHPGSLEEAFAVLKKGAEVFKEGTAIELRAAGLPVSDGGPRAVAVAGASSTAAAASASGAPVQREDYVARLRHVAEVLNPKPAAPPPADIVQAAERERGQGDSAKPAEIVVPAPAGAVGTPPADVLEDAPPAPAAKAAPKKMEEGIL